MSITRNTSGRMAMFLLATLPGLAFALPASASSITVASPVNGTNISSPAWIRAHNVGCNGLAPTAFGYSIDGASGLVVGVTPYDIDVVGQGIPSGQHTVHFKSWTSAGICPVVDTTFNVNGGSSGSAPVSAPPSSPSVVNSIPSYAAGSVNLDTVTYWNSVHDGGTPGWSSGSTVFPASTPSYDDAREFYMTYSGHGGQRWSTSFGNDANATHFILDTYVYFKDPEQVQNLELDLNQVMANGETVIMGTQCSSITHTWETTYTSGSSDHWHSTNVGCNPMSWGANQWHHVQIAMHRDGNGVVTHDWVNVDGTHSVFSGAVGGAGLWLGWARGALVVNYQMEGAYSGGGSITSYIHAMTVYRW